jgi:SAM-dependent methyltransferase
VSLWNVADYVRLRTGGDDEQLAAFARRNDLRGRRVLEIGCGPGRGAAALAERYGARVTALDASPAMLAAAREHTPASVDLILGRAEQLPFPDGTFEAAVAQFVVHLLDRPRAFAEVRRVLTPDGVLFVKTVDPELLDGHWALPLLPSYLGIEQARFPTEAALRADLAGAGFARVDVERAERERVMTRDEAIEELRSGAYSTMRLLSPGELAEGIRRAPDVLDDLVRYTLTQLTVDARP